MISFLVRSLRWLQDGTLKLLLFAIVLLLVWGMLAPVGTLVWWLNQGSEILGLRDRFAQIDPTTIDPTTPAAVSAPTRAQPLDRFRSGAPDRPMITPAGDPLQPVVTPPTPAIDCYVVFLTGIGDYSTDQMTPGEEFFLDRLEQLHPNCVTVRDVFPYSAANEDLAGQQFLAPLWRSIEQADGWLKNADVLIKIRNLWRFAISADDRYGTMYNQGIANAILDRMDAAHAIATVQAKPINLILMGTSGGVQVALGTVPYLKEWLNARLTVVSAGGTFDGEAGFDQVDRVYHLRGQRDWVEDLPRLLFPSRWAWVVASPINRARQQGRYIALSSGPHTHDGKDGYFGLAIVTPPHRRSDAIAHWTAAQNAPAAPLSSTPVTYVELMLRQVDRLPIWSTLSGLQSLRDLG